MTNEHAIVTQSQSELEKVMGAVHGLQTLINIVAIVRSDILKPGLDYGVIPGTNAKPTLLLPGMEKLTRALNVRPEYVDISRIEDFDKPLFHYDIECRLVDVETGRIVPGGVGRGSCNSYEQSFGWRWVTEDRVPANLDKSTLEQRNGAIFEFAFAVEKAETTGAYGKPADYLQRFADAIADGTAKPEKRKTSKGKELDGWIIGGVEYRIPNPYVFDSVNAIMKRAKKRALGDAIKGAAAVSEYFTVDLEDTVDLEIIEGQIVEETEAVEANRRIALLGEIHRNINTLIGTEMQVSEIKRLAGLDVWTLDEIKAKHPDNAGTAAFARLVADRWADEQPKAKPTNGNGNHTEPTPEETSEGATDTNPKGQHNANSVKPSTNGTDTEESTSQAQNSHTKPVSNGNGGGRIGSKPEFSSAADMKHTPELKEVTLQLNTWKLLESDDKKPYIEFGGIVLLPESERTDAIKTTGEVAKINVRSLDDLQHAGFVSSDGTWDDIDGVKGRLDPEMYAVAIRTDVGKNGFSYKPETLSARAEVTEAAASSTEDVPF